MPHFFYGESPDFLGKRRLYSQLLVPIEGKFFNDFKISDLAPVDRPSTRFVANLWYIESIKHCALSWNQGGFEATLFYPGFPPMGLLLPQHRATFSAIMPSPIVFRVDNPDEPLIMD